MGHFTPWASLLGGVLLGLASSLLFAANGRICGISGIVGGIPVALSNDRGWRVVFLAGLLSGGALLLVFDRGVLAWASEQSVSVAIVAGVLVGVGTRLGNGCTSGHGLCGIARLSPRSVVATVVFMLAGGVTVYLVRHVLGAGGAS
jgi:uncharacterized membrane protein YedE/YeeE